MDCVNAPKDFIHGKALISTPRVIGREQLMDPGYSLKSVSASAAPTR
jgi:hypothetical protein